MNPRPPNKSLPFSEFVTLMALMMSMVALSIDAMLPALPDIGRDLGAADANDVQLVVALIFLGMALGQLFYGPLSDSIGRKPAVTLGIGIFALGCLCSLLAVNFQMMLIGRILQGVGLGAPRVVSVALIRDEYAGHAMARVMSFVMTIFILVPMVAPMVGQGVLLVAGWRAIFLVILVMGLSVLCWFQWRQPETLVPEKRLPFSLAQIGAAVREILSHRVALGYTLVAGFTSSAFLAYLSSVQQVLALQYGLGDLFPIVFAALALAIGSASYVNGRMVMRFGMQLICRQSLIVLCLVSVAYGGVAYHWAGHPPLWSLLCYFIAILFCTGLLFGNNNALAMEPLGHIAGIGAAVVGSLSTLVSVPLGISIGRAYEGSVMPLIAGFAGCSFASLLLVSWIESQRSLKG